ncbi:MAG: hypothetical protein COY58_01810 [Gammaproteobacteria bacterium CG_4_10_14_0_8_um_filter_38_16]|nr:MAG: hypothetical protein COY58_01810 [Gammaproteobacteria bacterium CG_4_10_14_0_8_um_filter_38_16]PJA04051.1 MAG: hypothetical protein COX72_01595 [Gammaproteobacteria bacterium CG_4_10_14_0_2_um_filter_38_22]PJB09589.1 MAG: hypothetical protein CO120_09245 [Gammaproteobacteria bacterium CG_4_9_14_3_um_filter_38_9]
MRLSDLDTLINNANQAFSTYTSAADKSKTNVKKALETAIHGALQVLRQVFNEDGSFKDSIAEGRRPIFFTRIQDFFNPLVPQLTDIYKTHYVKHLTETAITHLTALCEIITNSKIFNFSAPFPLLEIIDPEVTKVRKQTIGVAEIEQFFESMLSGKGIGEYRRDRYTAPRARYGEPEQTTEEKQAVMIALGCDIEILRAMLDNHGITKEQVSDLISGNWENLINYAPLRSFLQFSHILKQ